MKKWALGLVGLALLAAFGYWFACVPAKEYPHGTTSIARFTPGPHAVVVDEFRAVDESRPTPPNHEFTGAPVRMLKGALWRPQGLQQPGPLLVYSHGFMSFHQEGQYLATFLASHGYTVVAVDYPLTNYSAPGKPRLADVVNQPGDVAFLIDTLLKRSRDTNDVLHGTIDENRIAVAGVSLGGLTSTLAAYHRKVLDRRIAAAVSIGGPTFMFTPQFFAGSHVPFMMVAADADAMVPYAKNAQPLQTKFPGSILVSLRNASHAGFAAPAATFMRFFSNPDAVGCRALRKGLLNNAGDGFMDSLAGADVGVEFTASELPCSYGVPATAMKAARQQMLTTLAVEAFLDSRFAADAAARDEARRYLLQTFPAENAEEVRVETQQE
jgi:predicted dienelactone hydrolase